MVVKMMRVMCFGLFSRAEVDYLAVMLSYSTEHRQQRGCIQYRPKVWTHLLIQRVFFIFMTMKIVDSH